LSAPRARSPGGAVRLVLAVAFLAWAGAFVARSSVAGVDGRRYFCLFDDAMISMRYASNLAHGQGLVWNPGERVEGYTNLLWTLVMAAPTRLLDRSEAALAMQVLGALVLLGLAFAMARVARDVDPSRPGAATLAFAFSLFYYPLAYWTLLGMETGLVALLVALAVHEAFAGDGGPASWRLSVILALAYLTRPDTLVIAALVLGYRALAAARPSAAAREAAGVAVVVALHTALRVAYYGELVPNTYRLKVAGIPLLARIVNGRASSGPWAALVAPLALLALGALSSVSTRRAWLLVSLASSLFAYQVWIGGDLNDHWRFLCTAALLLVPLVPAGASAWGRRLAPGGSPRAAPATVAAVVAAAVALPAAPFAAEQAFLVEAKSVPQNRQSVNVALVLDDLLEPGATIAVFWAGTIPYYAPFRAFDILGKSDPWVASLPPDLSGAVSWSRMRYVPGHNRYDLQRTVDELRPTFLEHEVWGRDDLSGTIGESYVAVLTPYGRLLLRRGSPDVRWQRLPGLPSE